MILYGYILYIPDLEIETKLTSETPVFHYKNSLYELQRDVWIGKSSCYRLGTAILSRSVDLACLQGTHLAGGLKYLCIPTRAWYDYGNAT